MSARLYPRTPKKMLLSTAKIGFTKNNSAGSGSVPQYASGYSTNFGNYDLQHISNVIYMNGTTDYVHFHLSSNQSTQIHNGSSWMGWLLYPAA